MENNEIDLSNIVIPKKAQIRVEWKDKPENYSVEAKKDITSYFSNKYGIPKERIRVSYIATKTNSKGEEIRLGDEVIENIMDNNFQRKLFQQYIKDNNIEVDFDEILKIDDIVNGEVNYTVEDRNRSYKIKKVWVDNFLCFGENVNVNFEELKGLISITSVPSNMGGKTTFFINVISFLLFGSTDKIDKLEDAFNLYSDKDKVLVKGLVEIDNENFIIERTITRSKKKAGGYTTNSKVKYYSINSDNEELELNETDKDSIKTTQKIKETLGSEEDFKLIVSADARSLEDIIDTKPTERSNMVHRFLGLEIIFKKEEVAKRLEATYKKSMLSNVYTKSDLTDKNTKNEEKIVINDNLNVEKNKLLETTTETITLLENDKKTLTESKKTIDSEVLRLDSNTLKNNINIITENGKTKAGQLTVQKNSLVELGDVNFDETKYREVIENDKKLSIEKNNISNEINNLTKENTRLAKENEELKKAEICPILKLKCDKLIEHNGNSPKFIENELKVTENNVKIEELEGKLVDINVKITDNKKLEGELLVIKTNYEKKQSIDLIIPKIELELANLRADLLEKREKLKLYETNKDNIDSNNKIELDIQNVDARIKMSISHKDNIIREIQSIENENQSLRTNIEDNNKKINKIEEEGKILRNYQIYSSLLSKNGISKIVLKNTIPIINSEMTRLMEDAEQDFEIEFQVDEKNNIQFYLVRDDVYTNIKSISGFERTASALLIRDVFSKISTLPKPNFIVFDEITGKIANEFFSSFKTIIDKISGGYDSMFLISHDEKVKDWCEKIVVFEKVNNISKIKVE